MKLKDEKKLINAVARGFHVLKKNKEFLAKLPRMRLSKLDLGEPSSTATGCGCVMAEYSYRAGGDPLYAPSGTYADGLNRLSMNHGESEKYGFTVISEFEPLNSKEIWGILTREWKRWLIPLKRQLKEKKK